MSGQSIRKQANKKPKQNKKHGNALDLVTSKTPEELKGPYH